MADNTNYDGENFNVSKNIDMLSDNQKAYKKFLENCSLIFLKKIVKQYNLHTKINTNKALKEDLINGLLYHTEFRKVSGPTPNKDKFIISVKNAIKQDLKSLVRRAYAYQFSKGAKPLGRLGTRKAQPRIPTAKQAKRTALSNVVRKRLNNFGFSDELLLKLEDEKLTLAEVKKIILENLDRAKFNDGVRIIKALRRDNREERKERRRAETEQRRQERQEKRQDKRARIAEERQTIRKIRQQKRLLVSRQTDGPRERTLQDERREYLEREAQKAGPPERTLQDARREYLEREAQREAQKAKKAKPQAKPEPEPKTKKPSKAKLMKNLDLILDEAGWNSLPENQKSLYVDMIKMLETEGMELPNHLEEYINPKQIKSKPKQTKSKTKSKSKSKYEEPRPNGAKDELEALVFLKKDNSWIFDKFPNNIFERESIENLKNMLRAIKMRQPEKLTEDSTILMSETLKRLQEIEYKKEEDRRKAQKLKPANYSYYIFDNYIPDNKNGKPINLRNFKNVKVYNSAKDLNKEIGNGWRLKFGYHNSAHIRNPYLVKDSNAYMEENSEYKRNPRYRIITVIIYDEKLKYHHIAKIVSEYKENKYNLHIDFVDVHPEHQGKGLGQKLFDFLFEYLDHLKLSIKTLELTYAASHMGGLKLYAKAMKKHGWKNEEYDKIDWDNISPKDLEELHDNTYNMEWTNPNYKEGGAKPKQKLTKKELQIMMDENY